MKTSMIGMLVACTLVCSACLGAAPEERHESSRSALDGYDWCNSECEWWNEGIQQCVISCAGNCASWFPEECGPVNDHRDCGPEDHSQNWPYPGVGCSDEG